MQYPQLVLGMLAIFTYVGVEVTIQSNERTLKEIEIEDLSHKIISNVIEQTGGNLR